MKRSSLKSIVFSILILAIATVQLKAQKITTYYKVLLEVNDNSVFAKLAANDLYVDHVSIAKTGYVFVLDDYELEKLKGANVPYKILITDLERHYENKIAEDAKNPTVQQMMKTAKQGFTLGSHAGYYTPAEIVNKLDEMSNDYPNITTTKTSIGTTYEGRDIYMIKISDNPNLDESANEPAVYYDAMHHAREPLSMMTTIYYMFWLLENYGTDPVATHLVNNRELYFVPIVNVDGYEYNISTNPNGGGLWRKTRKPNPGSSCIGTDPNRNYGADWGEPGASTSPCSNTYRGNAAFSENCTQAVRDLVDSINLITGFSCHSYSEIYIESDYNLPSDEKFYADYSLDMCETNNWGYEQAEALLYEVSGGTTEYLNSIGAISYTPEIGLEFWEPASEIIPYAEKHLPSFIYIAQVAGDYPDIKQVNANNRSDLLAGQSYDLDIEIFNKGRTKAASNIAVTATSNSSNITINNFTTNVANVPARQTVWSSSNPISFSVNNNAVAGDIVEIELAVFANGIEYERETQRWVVGYQTILFSESGNSFSQNFTQTGIGLSWDTTYVMKRSGNECFSDSPAEAANNNTLNYLMMSSPVDLTNLTAPKLEFWMAWGLSNLNSFTGGSSISEDNLKLEIRTSPNGSWTALAADDTQLINGAHRYVLNNAWAKQIVDLSPYINSVVQFRFTLETSDSSQPDGVFIDNFRIVEYQNNQNILPTAVINGGDTLNIYVGNSITLTHSSSNYAGLLWDSGNGSTSVNNTVTFTYNTIGTYVVSLEASNLNGFDTDSIVIIVNEEDNICTDDTLVYPNPTTIADGTNKKVSDWILIDSGNNTTTINSGFNVSLKAGNRITINSDFSIKTGANVKLYIEDCEPACVPVNYLYGGSGEDYLESMSPTSDGGFVFAGFGTSSNSGDVWDTNSGSNDYWIVKADNTGTIEWSTLYGFSSQEKAYSVKQTADGGYIVVGTSYQQASNSYDALILRLNASGNTVWAIFLNATDVDVIARDVAVTDDGGYIVTGYLDNNGQNNAFAAKIDDASYIVWSKTLNASYGMAVNQAANGTYTITGYDSNSSGADDNVWVINLSEDGDTVNWEKLFGFSADDRGLNGQPTSDGGYIIGATTEGQQDYDYWIIKLDSIGDVEWNKILGGNGRDVVFGVEQTTDGGYILGGHSDSSNSGDVNLPSNGQRDYLAIKLNATGDMEWQNLIGGNLYDAARAIHQTSDGGYLVGGHSLSSASGDVTDTSNGQRDAWIVKLNANGDIVSPANCANQLGISSSQ